MMTCIIIEDQPPAQRILKKFIQDIGNLDLKGTFTDAVQGLEFLQQQKVDLIFLDIHLPKLSGMEFLNTLVKPPHIILTTAFPDYALKSYEFNVVDYLLKPFSFERFVKAVSKVPLTNPATSLGKELSEIFIKSGYEHIKIDLNELLYIHSDADYTELFLPENRYLSSEPLRHWEETLPGDQFYRIHKSYIINISKIEKVSGNQVVLQGQQPLPIGRAYKEGFLSHINL